MISLKLDDLSMAFGFVSAAPPGENNAYISLDTGEIHWRSEMNAMDEDVPDDLETSDRYLAVSHKTDLDLGKRLALRFVARELPDCYDQVAGFFRREAPMPSSSRCSIPKALSIGGMPTKRSRSSRR